MKKILFSAVSALALASFAADSTQFAVQHVPSAAKNTIVAVPWIESSTGSDNVSVSNLVLTSGLEVDDELRHYNGTDYDCWKIAQDSQGVKYWTPSGKVTAQGQSTTGDASDVAIQRGKAVMVIRKGSSLSGGFYIMGKPATVSADPTTLTAPGYTLVAPPVTGDANNENPISINDGLTWSLGEDDGEDYLYVPNAKTGAMAIYRYVDGVWKKTTTGVTNGTIPYAMGAWFYTTGEGTKTVQIKQSAN